MVQVYNEQKQVEYEATKAKMEAQGYVEIERGIYIKKPTAEEDIKNDINFRVQVNCKDLKLSDTA